MKSPRFTRRLVAVTAFALPLVSCASAEPQEVTCNAKVLPGDLVITEIFAAAASQSANSAVAGDEWFEIYNATLRPIDLDGVTLTLSRLDGSRAQHHVVSAMNIDPGAYLVLGDDAPDKLSPWVNYSYGADLGAMTNTGGKLALTCGDTTIDAATYQMATRGESLQFDGNRTPDYVSNDEGSNWCTATPAGSSQFLAKNYGTPGASNEDCVIATPGMCSDNGSLRPINSATVGDLVITEVMADPAKAQNTTGEWIEVLATRDLDLNGVVIERDDSVTMPDVISDARCLAVPAGTDVVFARSIDGALNGQLPRVDGTFNFALPSGTEMTPATVQLAIGGEVLDAVHWTRAPSGKSHQLDPDFSTVDANDNERYWCDAATAYGAGDLGTPGMPNDRCALLPPMGTCNDGGTFRPIVEPQPGQLVIDEWMPDPTLVSDDQGEWFELRANADVDLNGLQVGSQSLGTTPVVSSASCVHLAAGSVMVFARNLAPTANGQLHDAAFVERVTLGNDHGTLQIGLHDLPIDAVTWTSSTAGHSFVVDSHGTQCATPVTIAPYNGRDVGTPGTSNPQFQCP